MTIDTNVVHPNNYRTLETPMTARHGVISLYCTRYGTRIRIDGRGDCAYIEIKDALGVLFSEKINADTTQIEALGHTLTIEWIGGDDTCEN